MHDYGQMKRYWKNTLPFYLIYLGLILIMSGGMYLNWPYAQDIENFLILIGFSATLLIIHDVGKRLAQ